MSDAELQDEELVSLESIYGEDATINHAERLVQVHIPSLAHPRALVLRAHLPPAYPSACPPVVDLAAGPHWMPHCAPGAAQAALDALVQRFVPGSVVLFEWVEVLRESHQGLWDSAPGSGEAEARAAAEGAEEAAGAAECAAGEHGTSAEGSGAPEGGGEEGRTRKGPAHLDPELVSAVRARIVSGEPRTERKSTFQAHVAPVHSTEEVFAVMAVLLESNKIRNATHNIMAYRIHEPHRATLAQDCDDDGEAAAGGRLLHMLQAADVTNACVIVSRWFGGVLLGPQRFALINNTARDLLEAQGYIQPGGSKASRGKQRGAKAGSMGAK